MLSGKAPHADSQPVQTREKSMLRSVECVSAGLNSAEVLVARTRVVSFAAGCFLGELTFAPGPMHNHRINHSGKDERIQEVGFEPSPFS